MKIKKIFYMLTVLSLLFCIFANTAFASTTFKDVSSNHWASKAIEEMHAAGVINGYPDGTFKPDAPVTRLHAIIMLVRANNLQKAAEEYDLNNSPYEFPPGISEASKKYLAVAADKNWIVGERMKAMKPNNAATREEIVALIGAAFNLKGDFEKLPFIDKNNISTKIRSWVAGVYEAGIIKGKTPLMFYPKSQIKRSELAVIFMRLSDKGKINPAPGKRIDGYLKEYNSAINRIKIQSTDGITRALTLHPNALVYIGDVKSSPSALRINQLLRLYLNEHNQVVFLKTIDSITPSSTVSYTEDKASGDDKKYWGYVYELKPNKLKLKLLSDDYRTFSLSENLVLYDENNKRKSLLALNKDDFIELELSQNKIVEIRITQYSEVVGNIYRLRNDWITISRHGRLYLYSICEHTTKFTDTDGDEY
ncbi:S-layer homology domain-containing protein, partial [Peptococcaceae bacterium]|nr:S-layer homology domain-containing protein [Peptococcaceae bacterium]